MSWWCQGWSPYLDSSKSGSQGILCPSGLFKGLNVYPTNAMIARLNRMVCRSPFVDDDSSESDEDEAPLPAPPAQRPPQGRSGDAPGGSGVARAGRQGELASLKSAASVSSNPFLQRNRSSDGGEPLQREPSGRVPLPSKSPEPVGASGENQLLPCLPISRTLSLPSSFMCIKVGCRLCKVSCELHAPSLQKLRACGGMRWHQQPPSVSCLKCAPFCGASEGHYNLLALVPGALHAPARQKPWRAR